jgi:hypothetical protein
MNTIKKQSAFFAAILIFAVVGCTKGPDDFPKPIPEAIGNDLCPDGCTSTIFIAKSGYPDYCDFTPSDASVTIDAPDGSHPTHWIGSGVSFGPLSVPCDQRSWVTLHIFNPDGCPGGKPAEYVIDVEVTPRYNCNNSVTTGCPVKMPCL